MSQPVADTAGVYALLADGSTVQIRPARPGDFADIKAMHEAMSPGNAYLRFFSISRAAAEREARRVTREPGPDHAALLALYDAEVVGVASYEVLRNSGGKTAEVAFAVSDTMHHRGIATLLLEHLVSLARARRIELLTAETLSENVSMLRVFSDAGPARPQQPRRRRGHDNDPAAARRHRQAAGGIPGHRGGPRAVRRRGQPPAGVRTAMRRGDRGEPPAGHGRPFRPRQHQDRRLPGQPLRGQPERHARYRRRPVLPRCGQPAGNARPRADRGAAARGHRRGGGLRRPRRPRARGVHRGASTPRGAPTCSPSAAGTACG